MIEGINIPDFRCYEDAVAFGIECREGRDAFSWPMGDAFAAVCKPNPNGGRPPAWAEGCTIAAYARDVGIGASTGSGLMHNARFWGKADREKMPPQISWWH